MSNKRTFQKIYVLVAFLVASFIRKLGEDGRRQYGEYQITKVTKMVNGSNPRKIMHNFPIFSPIYDAFLVIISG